MSLPVLQAAFEARRRHASPFLVLGDPTPSISVELAVDAVEAGATMLELGMPFSDPCADGPAIQAACARAFAAGVSTGQALDLLAEVHARTPRIPKNLLVYGNLVHARGYAAFCERAAAAGASSLLVPDVPFDEAAELRAMCAEHGLGHVQLVAPTTPAARLEQLVRHATGFLYLAAYQGVTGSQAGASSEATVGALVQQETAALVRRVVAHSALPACVGFGLSAPAHLQSAFDAGARLCVVGSHLARRIGEAFAAASPAARARATRRAFVEAWRPLAAVADPTVSTPED